MNQMKLLLLGSATAVAVTMGLAAAHGRTWAQSTGSPAVNTESTTNSDRPAAEPAPYQPLPPDQGSPDSDWSSDDPRIGTTLMITEGITDENGIPARDEWTFEHLMQEMSGAHDPALFVANWLRSFEDQPEINGLFPLVRPGPDMGDGVSGISTTVS